MRDWKKMTSKLKNAISTRKAFHGPKHGRFPEVDLQVLKFVQEQRMKPTLNALEIANTINLPQGSLQLMYQKLWSWCWHLC